MKSHLVACLLGGVVFLPGEICVAQQPKLRATLEAQSPCVAFSPNSKLLAARTSVNTAKPGRNHYPRIIDASSPAEPIHPLRGLQPR